MLSPPILPLSPLQTQTAMEGANRSGVAVVSMSSISSRRLPNLLYIVLLSSNVTLM